MPQKPLFDRRGGYRRLYSFTFATMIHLGTIRFCKRFVSYRDDPLGKTAGQMIGAARSGRQNIIEASERAATSKETEIKLTDVARASLGELLGDYEIHLADKGVVPWSCGEPERRNLGALRLPAFEYTDDTLHDYWVYYHKAQKPFLHWLESDDDTVVANAMVVIISRTMAMLNSQIQTQGENFLESGGFRERMFECRSEARQAGITIESDAPNCPECNKPMRRRTARNGKSAGAAFWGCTAYPACKGTRPDDRMTQ